MKDIGPIYLQMQEKRKPKKKVLNLKKNKIQCLYTPQHLQKVATRISFLVAYNEAKHNKSFSDSEFVKQCMVG
jgi:hypothetical protein